MKKALLSQDVYQDESDRRAKDERSKMLLAVPGRLVSVERLARRGVARSQSLAVADPVCGYPLRRRAANRDDLASGSRGQRRLPGLLLLPGSPWTQDQYGRHAVVGVDSADLAVGRSDLGG